MPIRIQCSRQDVAWHYWQAECRECRDLVREVSEVGFYGLISAGLRDAAPGAVGSGYPWHFGAYGDFADRNTLGAWGWVAHSAEGPLSVHTKGMFTVVLWYSQAWYMRFRAATLLSRQLGGPPGSITFLYGTVLYGEYREFEYIGDGWPSRMSTQQTSHITSKG